jgi:hypothetical protein
MVRRLGMMVAAGVLLGAWIGGGVAVGQATRGSWVNEVVLQGVPDYQWNFGCGPTAAAMVIGYWQRQKEAFYPLVEYRDGQGRRAPVPVDDRLTRSRPGRSLGPANWDNGHGDVQIDRFIASLGHSRDYWDFTRPAEALYSLTVDPMLDHHADDSLADFLWTSRGLMGMNGSTVPWDMAAGMKRYSEWRGFGGDSGYTVKSEMVYVPIFVQVENEIREGNPAILMVDLKGSWLHLDWHYVTAFGYQDLGPGGKWVAVRDTWKSDRAYGALPIETKVKDGVRWWKWNTEFVSAKAAVRGMITFRLERDRR